MLLFVKVGVGGNESVRVPFTLPPNTENEGQFAFHVNSIAMPQRLKGILTYIVKVLLYSFLFESFFV